MEKVVADEIGIGWAMLNARGCHLYFLFDHCATYVDGSNSSVSTSEILSELTFIVVSQVTEFAKVWKQPPKFTHWPCCQVGGTIQQKSTVWWQFRSPWSSCRLHRVCVKKCYCDVIMTPSSSLSEKRYKYSVSVSVGLNVTVFKLAALDRHDCYVIAENLVRDPQDETNSSKFQSLRSVNWTPGFPALGGSGDNFDQCIRSRF